MPSENPLFALPDTLLRPMVEQALSEDLGRRGDITSAAVIAPDKTAKLFLVSREDGVIAGMDLARIAFQTMDPSVRFQAEIQDGQAVRAGQTLAAVEGNARALLAAERTALNYLTHLSGIATATARAVAEVAEYGTDIVCSRKTIPLLRVLQKYAVRAGGGANHRMGLDDAVLIKDNHLAYCGSIAQAVRQAKQA
ncbi:carboxylating nicotinate-nucleotide diphosphorylase, partial [Neisseria gonorrhoeae]